MPARYKRHGANVHTCVVSLFDNGEIRPKMVMDMMIWVNKVPEIVKHEKVQSFIVSSIAETIFCIIFHGNMFLVGRNSFIFHI